MDRINIDPQVKKKVFQKYNGRCYYCGRPLTYGEATMDHVIPLAKGGTNSIDNFVLSCSECNVLKGDRSVEDFKIAMYSLLANAYRYINANLYNYETGELHFFGELNKSSIKEISKEDTSQLNNMMKSQTPQRNLKGLSKPGNTNTSRLSYEDFASLVIDNPYDTSRDVDKPFTDKDWNNDNILAEKAFTSLLPKDKEKEIQKNSENIEISSEELCQDIQNEDNSNINIPTKEEQYVPNFIMMNSEEDKPIELKKIDFDIPKSISPLCKKFLNNVKYIVENTEISIEESVRVFYEKMDRSDITEKQYSQICKELIKREVINKHKKFRPRSYHVTNIIV